jgi:hypothetical protein
MKLPKPKDVGENVSPREFLNSEQRPVVTADPATFVIAVMIMSKVRESASELREILLRIKPDFEAVIETVFARMTQVRIIDIIQDRIVLLKSDLYLDLRDAKQFEFLPKVMTAVARRLRQDSVEGVSSVRHGLEWITFPDHPKVRKRTDQITRQYLIDMKNLEREVDADPDIRAERVRFCLVMNGNLEPKDF